MVVERALKVFLWVLIFNLPVMQVGKDFHIWFERSGGFGGMTVKTEIESESITPEEAEKIRHWIDQINFFEVQISDSLTLGQPDQFTYKIKLESDEKARTLEFNDSTIPVNFHPFVRYLVQKARSR